MTQRDQVDRRPDTDRTVDRAVDREADRPPVADAPVPLVPAPSPEIRALTTRECEALLRRNQVGRIAFSFDRRVEILPIHYVYDDGWLYGRTSPGDKIAMWRHSHWVAFEVDEVRGLFDWASVVVHGALYLLRPEETEANAAEWERAVGLLRRLLPETAGMHDPVPHRNIVFRIHADHMDGRMALPPPPPA
ncbi:MAG TPA: pyridoxamine 5'-phosphate oxidase family protein [Gemmatimonadaceae bacterium]|jgi:nitroimidazol reductase NimA-like FMN-containing flavoprotein (pyridoxamine 5'-phosphate oxidase superfamily)